MSSSFQEFADHLRIPFEDIASATSNFAEENLIGQGGFGKVYKGKLLRSGQLINIAARRLDRKYGQGDHEFRTEIWVLSRLKHDNLVSIVGFCDDDGEKIIINKYEVNGSLDKYLSGPTLTWMQRLRICLDAARALSYIHYHTGRSYGIIHRNIKSSKILLDAKWEVKVCGFGLSISNPANRMRRLVMSEPCGTLAYVDPVYTQTSSVTHKSDVYSFGVILFEVLCGRKAMIRDDGGHQFLAPLAKKHYKNRKLGEIMDPNLKKQMDPQSIIIFSETAYHCLKRQRTQRPDMEIVVKRLEKALEIQGKRENPEPSKIPAQSTSSNNIKAKNLQNLRIPLKDIALATKNFTKTRIGEGTYGKVYKAELYLVDSESVSAIEGKNRDELPKRRKTVAIKQIISRQDDQGEQGFFTEIELLSLCKHPNIVSLLGYCDEESHCILVYDLASKGSLDDHFGNIDKMTTLNWTKRIKICLGIACGLNYLHNAMKDKERIFHRDIKSANILLYDKWHAKIADFGLSKFHHASTLNASTIVGTEIYADPEYLKTGKYKNESDTYSFGVVLFEILCGKLAYDGSYYVGDDKGLPSSVRRRFKEDTLKEMVDPKLKEETDVKHFTLNRGPNQVSLDKYINIAYQCIAEAPDQRPTMKHVIQELEEALYYQINNKDNLKLPLEDIKSATEDFNDKNCIGRGGFGKVYKGELPHANGHKIIVAKRLDRSLGQGDAEFYSELEILFDYKDDDRIIGLVGYCDEMEEKIIVYEYATRGSLDRYLKENCLTWMKRLMICIDVARGLDFLHGTLENQEVVLIHRDIKSSNILLNEDWKAKITDFGLSLVCPINQEMDHIIDNPQGTPGYIDPHYMKWGVLSKGSDIYSFGVVLFEILCGRLGFEYYDGQFKLLSTEIKGNGKGRLDGMVFEGIRKQIVPESLTTFSKIAYQCLHDDRKKRPTAREVLVQLEKALEIQEEYKIWEPKLPADYKQIIQKSMSYEIYSLQKKKDLYTTFSNGILLTEGKLWFSLGNNGERNAMISAREFSYKIRRSHKWRSFPKSRFSKVAEMLDISNMKIQIKIRTRLLSPGVNYGVHLIFKFCDPRKSLAKRMYVNLKYIKENENLHAYFATWRKDEWMMIELCRFYNHKEDTDFEVLLESFSRCYCGSRTIYIEGIEFRAIDDVKHEGVEKLEELQVMKSNSSTDYKEIIERSESYDESGKENSSDNLQISPEDMKLAKQNFSDNNFQISLEDIKLATQNFSDNNLIGKISLEGFGKVYRGKVPHANGHNIIAVKRYNEVFGQGEVQFLTELEILFEHKHENVIGLVGYCYEMDEKIIAYEYASRGSLNGYLDDDCLTWKKRLEICIDVASGLDFLHGGGETQEMVIHRDIKSASILLNGEWKAKISNFGLSFICPIDREKDFVIMNVAGTFGYIDPLYVVSGIMTKESDIYSFGIVLFEILSGRLAYEKYNDGYRLLCDVAKDNMNEGRLEEMVFEGIKEQIVPESLTTYSTIAYQCLHDERKKRPTASEVLEQLKKALELQLRSSESKMTTKKDQMLSAKNVLYDSFNVKLFNSKPTVQSRVEGEIELPRQQVFRIKCKIDSQILSPNTENVCYLVFKLSKKCCGLHCPVIVRDLHQKRNKETRILYFRSPSPWNLHETDWVPEERTDGWMEVIVWKFNSTYELKNDGLLVNLKLISYEGTMSGLIVRGITFRPM